MSTTSHIKATNAVATKTLVATNKIWTIKRDWGGMTGIQKPDFDFYKDKFSLEYLLKST